MNQLTDNNIKTGLKILNKNRLELGAFIVCNKYAHRIWEVRMINNVSTMLLSTDSKNPAAATTSIDNWIIPEDQEIREENDCEDCYGCEKCESLNC